MDAQTLTHLDVARKELLASDRPPHVIQNAARDIWRRVAAEKQDVVTVVAEELKKAGIK